MVNKLSDITDQSRNFLSAGLNVSYQQLQNF